MKKKVEDTTKIVLLQPEVTWIVHGIKSMTHQVLPVRMDRHTFHQLQDLRGIVQPSPQWDLTQWAPLQQQLAQQQPTLYPNSKILRRASDGLLLFTPTPTQTLTIVPEKHVKELVLWQHRKLCHAGQAKVYAALKKHWHWPDMKKDIRAIVTDCAPCQLLKAKRARAHTHFRSKVFCTPRTSWGCDFYGVEASKKKFNNILGIIDLATSECRLFACTNRTADTVSECLLHGIILRDGCPLHLHSDAAREFISKAVARLCKLIGCQRTSTLAHHPTGNATIERLWRWVASCLRQMTKEQYKEWEKYVRLMEHVWNTSEHSTIQCSPFEAAHGLAARSVVDSIAAPEINEATDLMTRDGISAMRDTARAFEKQIQNLRTESTRSTAAVNAKGTSKTYSVGDTVSFYIPPTEKEAKNMGRKPKHLLQYRGPATVTKVLSDTTYQLDHEGRTYYRCFSELRPYKSKGLPVTLPVANPLRMQEIKLKPGNFVSLCDTDDKDDVLFHLCRVLSVENDEVELLNYATWGKRLKSAKFSILYQDTNSSQYTTKAPAKKAKEQEVIDRVPLEDVDGYVDHYDIRMTKAMRISKPSQTQLARLGLKHHVLGETFP